ncbi:Reverse transcriptase zinc-binding domain [Sesbania bispinosa]|nr:Reverse transcriptase zinc-binding domain [Sesbania bispinosa]
MLNEEVCLAILKSLRPMNTYISDDWFWESERNGMYSVSFVYNWLMQNYRNFGSEDVVWKHNWALIKLPDKLKFFSWQCLHNALPMNQKQFSCKISSSPACPRCSSQAETLIHCLRDCLHSKELWLHRWSLFHYFLLVAMEVINRLFLQPEVAIRLTPREYSWFKLPRTNDMGVGGVLRDSEGTWAWGFNSFEGTGGYLQNQGFAVEF